MSSRVSRAKQFLPFDSLKGFNEALSEKRIEKEEKRELCDEVLMELNNIYNGIGFANKGSYMNTQQYLYRDNDNADQYFITNNWDFSKYLFGASSNLNGQTPLFSLVVYLVYTLLLLFLTINRFTRKDVYNE